nr:MAG TPA: Protein of unknown function (DUF2897) [Caudoviricetes sp.]
MNPLTFILALFGLIIGVIALTLFHARAAASRLSETIKHSQGE